MSDDLGKAKKSRQGTFMNAQKEIKKAESYGSQKTFPLDKARVCLLKLREYYSDLKGKNAEILGLTPDEKVDDEVTCAADMCDAVLEQIATLGSLIESHASSPEMSPNRAHSLVVDSESTSKKEQSVKLPKLDIRKFAGDPLLWQEFWDSFSSTIDQNKSLSDIDKFKYLKNYLDGDALRLADGYMLTAANYSAVVEALKDRFGNEQLMVFSHVSALLALPESDHAVGSLQKTFDSCEKHIRSLLALGLPESHFEQVFTPIILSKLPRFVKAELYRENGTKPWSLSRLRELLRNEIRAREMSDLSFDSAGKPNNRSKPTDGSSSPRPSSQKTLKPTAAMLVGSEKRPKCRFCQESHYSDQCRKYPTVESRKEKIFGSCFSCLRSGHTAKTCKDRRPCVYCKRSGHHRSMCETRSGSSSRSSAANTHSESLNAGAPSFIPAASQMISAGQLAVLQTAIAPIQVDQRIAGNARLLFDTACSRTCISALKAQELELRSSGEEVISVAGFQDRHRKTVRYKVVEFDVVLRNGSSKRITANVVPQISCPIQKFPISVTKFPILTHVPLAEPLPANVCLVDIDILIGGDYYYDFMDPEWINCSDGLVLQGSKLGYIPSGRISDASTSSSEASCLLNHHLFGSPSETTPIVHLERFWALDEIGIKDHHDCSEDDEAAQFFQETVKFVDGRYQVAFPWRRNQAHLNDHHDLALFRLKSQVSRFQSNAALLDRYDKAIKEQETLSIIEKAPFHPDGPIVHYMPHHAVIRPDRETTKLRVVHNASAKLSKNDLSLNDCLYRGPVILEDLCGMLIRFRLHKIAIASDIEKAFLQVGIQPEDRDATRFLWLRDVSKPISHDNIVIFRFARVFFGSVSSPFLLGATIAHHLAKTSSPLCDEIRRNIYVDNLLGGRPSVQGAIEYYQESKLLFQKASMNLRQWCSNNQTFLESIPSCDRSPRRNTKVLGIPWQADLDCFSCPYGGPSMGGPVTKRKALQAVSSVYDPCGWICPVTLAGKLLVQSLWERKLSWDQSLPADDAKNLLKIVESYENISSIKIPRFVLEGHYNSSVRLHCFCDASGKAFAAVVYCCTGSTSNLLFAKSRLCPIRKQTTIPRLELVACVIGVRLLNFVQKEMRLNIVSRHLWSDSQCALSWLKQDQVATPFIANRLREIRAQSDIQFRYVPSSENPADLATRGCAATTLAATNIWWKGPQWLTVQGDWPIWNPTSKPPEILNSETSLLAQILRIPQHGINVEFQRFSSLRKLVRVVAWALRFIRNCLSRIKLTDRYLVAAELEASRLALLRCAQSQAYADATSQRHTDFQLLIKQLRLFVDKNSLVRCQGRYAHSDLSEEAKFPILLPKLHPLTRLIILDAHERCLHGSALQTLSRIRQRYWIVHGKSKVKFVLKDCRICRRAEEGAFKYPSAPALPPERVTRSRPFAATGLDHFGPLIANNCGTEQKVWVMMFTCAATRAVHLEVVLDLSSEQVLLGLKRFVSLYTEPDTIISDNAKNFQAVRRFLDKFSQSLQSDPVQNYAADKNVQWKFITEKAPWMGGFYERMVGIVKRTLKKVLHRRKLTLIELQTVIVETAACVNSRPLVLGDDPSDPTLTPAHFLARGSCIEIPLTSKNLPTDPDPDYSDSTPSESKSLTLTYRRIQSVLNDFWTSWRASYLASLRERSANVKQHNSSTLAPSCGSVVQIKDSGPRCQWRVGRVVKLHSSTDGQCRAANVKLSTGAEIKRPLNLIFPLEIEPEENRLVCGAADNQTGPTELTSNRRQRAAAIKAQNQISRILQEN